VSGLTLNPVVSYWLVALCAIVLMGLLFVRPRHVRLSTAKLATLAALRLGVVLLTLLALLRPTFVYTELKPQSASLLLLIDSSRSMEVEDSLGNASRWAALKSLLAESAGELATLAAKLDVKVYAFDAETRPVEMNGGRISLPDMPTGGQSTLGASMDDILNREASSRVLAAMILSDGAQRAVAPRDVPPHLAAGRFANEEIPLYTFCFGLPGGTGRADLRIDDLATSSTVFAQTPTEVLGQLLARGYANQPVRLQLLWENDHGEMEVVDTREVDTGLTGEPIPVTLRYTPTEPGERKVTLRAEPREGELITSNNEASTFVTVREGGINVLYLVGAKRPGGRAGGREQRFVRTSLATSPDIHLQRMPFDYQPPERDIREQLRPGEFDVVVLDDVDATALSRQSWQALVDFVARGGGLMVLGGYHSYGPGGYRGLSLANVLPMEIGFAERQNFDEPLRTDVHVTDPVKMRPAAPLGTRHPVMRLGRDSIATWQALPPLDGANRFDRERLKPSAMVLAESDDAAALPLLVAGQPGTGRVLAFAGDSTWRWPMQGHDDAHRRFWRQSILWLAKKDEQRGRDVWIELATRRVSRGNRIDIAMGASDAQLAPIESARFDVEVERPDGTRESLRPARQDDDWSATFRDTAAPGDYVVHVTARDGNTELGTARARFLVPDQDLELDRPAADPALLAQLAEITSNAGGQALAPEEMATLLKRLAAEPPEVKEEILAKITYWDTWPFLLTFVTLIGVEWYLRKRWGLV
jgi:uncharacterized membrane protein